MEHRHLGPREAAARVGVSRQRLHKLIETYADFPEPVARLRMGPVWHQEDIDRWLLTNWYRPSGRPRKYRDRSPIR